VNYRLAWDIPTLAGAGALRSSANDLLTLLAAVSRPEFDEFTRGLADIARPQMPHIEDLIAGLGSLQSVDFKGVGPGGPDLYNLKFEHGSLEWRIFLDADGKIASQFFHPLP
jgi:hypothetical protein